MNQYKNNSYKTTFECCMFQYVFQTSLQKVCRCSNLALFIFSSVVVIMTGTLISCIHHYC